MKNKQDVFWVKIPVNLISIKDEGILKILIQLIHLENIKNQKVSHQFLADVLNTSKSTVKRRLSLLKKLNFVNIVSGKRSHDVNYYSINRPVYDSFVNKVNSFRNLGDRIEFIDNCFGKNLINDSVKDNLHTKEKDLVSEFEQLLLSNDLKNKTNCCNDILEILQSDDFQDKIDNPKMLAKILSKSSEIITKEEISTIMNFFIDNATINRDTWFDRL